MPINQTQNEKDIINNDWSAKQYLKYEQERKQPCMDLIHRIHLDNPNVIVDIGCGPGNSTENLLQRWPNARVIGFDSSKDMVTKAKLRLPNNEFFQMDVTTWMTQEPVDLLFSNAVFHWLPNHVDILRKLFKHALKSNGILAVHMPDTVLEPSHMLMEEAAEETPWAKRLIGKQRIPLPHLKVYFDALTADGLTKHIEICRTIYPHPLNKAEDIVEWGKGADLLPFLHALNDQEQEHYLQIYTEKIKEAYPRDENGKVHMNYPRVFIIAQKK